MQEPGRRPGDDREVRCVCELVGLLFSICRKHGKLAVWRRRNRKDNLSRLKWFFKGTPTGVRYLKGDELVQLADRLVDRERRAARAAKGNAGA